MVKTQYGDLVNKLMAAAMCAAPDVDTQSQFVDMKNVMRAAGESDELIAIALASTLLDGLRYGTWFVTSNSRESDSQ